MTYVNVDFQAWNLQWRSYSTEDVFSITRQVKLIETKEFKTAALDPEYETFVIHIATFSVGSVDEMYPSKKDQIAYLKVDEISPKVLSKYSHFTDVFLPKLAIELTEYTRIDNHAIELVDN